MTEPLKVAFLWHQHQPNYKQPDQNIFILPWVRFHALKDYYDLVAILDDYPAIHQNINLVPSLLQQLNDYIDGTCEDRVQILTKKTPDELSESDKSDMLKYFFQLNHATMVDIYPGYQSLLQKRGRQFDEKNPGNTIKRFTNKNFRDLQVWYNLSWVGELHKNISPFKELIKKDHNFTEDDKHLLLDAQKEILKKIVPKHVEVEKRGQIEISSTPFYHPILPLLCDSEIARISQPEIQLPKRRFRYTQDAESQIQKAIEFHQNHFGKKPLGMWPSEGSVSEEVAAIFAKNKIQWIATDEEVLFNSWKLTDEKNKTRLDLYRPWQFNSDFGNIHIFFRDHELSDLIGFVYQNWQPEKASYDFISRLKNIRNSIIQNHGENNLKNSIVSVILDGENCWEYYRNNGSQFLHSLYSLFSKTPELKSVTFKEFLATSPQPEKLQKLFPGSWINHNFAIWIGHEEDNTAWDYLHNVRELVEREEKAGTLESKVLNEIKNELFIAEGSDWCWWYGDDHETENSLEFDQIFRSHLIRIYELLNKDVPVELYEPIRKKAQRKLLLSEPTGFISPIIDGIETNYFEWISAGVFDTKRQGSAMHQTVSFVESIHYGFDVSNLYLKIIPQNYNPIDSSDEYIIEIIVVEPVNLTIHCNIGELLKLDSTDQLLIKENKKWTKKKNGIKAAFKKFLELQLPFKTLHCSVGEFIKFQVVVKTGEQRLEIWPKSEMLNFKVPGPDFEQIEWIV